MAVSTRCPSRCCRADVATASSVTALLDLQPGSQPAHYFAGDASQLLLLAAGTGGGFGLLARAGDLLSRQRGGKAFLALEGEACSRCCRRSSRPTTPRVVALPWTLEGRLLVFGLDELKLQQQGRSRPDAHRPRYQGCAGQCLRLRRGPCACSEPAAAASPRATQVLHARPPSSPTSAGGRARGAGRTRCTKGHARGYGRRRPGWNPGRRFRSRLRSPLSRSRAAKDKP